MARVDDDPPALRIGGWLPGVAPAPPGAPSAAAPHERPAPPGRPMGPHEPAAPDQTHGTEAVEARALATGVLEYGAVPPRDDGQGGADGDQRRPRRTRTTVLAAAAVAAAVAVGAPVALTLRPERGAPDLVLPAPTPAPVSPVVPGPTGAGLGPAPTSGAAARTTAPAERDTAAPGVPRRSAPADDRSSDRPRLAAPPPDEPPAAPPPPAPSPVTVSYEAEAPANTRTGEARTKRVAAASGGTVVGFVGRRPGNTLRVAVTVPVADTYDVRVEYVSGEARPAQVRVNGGAAVPVRFPMTSADWSRVGSVTLRLRLAAGANTVEFGHPEQYTPDFDRFTVIRSS